MKFSDIDRRDIGTNVDSPVQELMSLGSEVRKATTELANKLDALSKQTNPDISYDHIDRMMRAICKQHGCDETSLHDGFIAAKSMTPDQYVRDRIRENSKKMVEASEFQEFEVFLVQIPANVYAGKYYNYRALPYYVYKGMDGVNTEDDAIRWVNDNQDTVLADIEGKRIRVGSKTVPHVKKPAHKNVFFKDRYSVRSSKVAHAVDHPNPKANYMPPKQELNEGPYDDRVQSVADAIIARSETVPIKREELAHWIEVEADYKRVPELGFKDRRGSRAWPDFVKDVLKELKGKVKFDRKTGPSASAADKRGKKQELLRKIANYIEDAFGQMFPDGDPMDYLRPRMARLGIDEYDFSKWLDAATKAHLRVTSFDRYMSNMYDDVAADSPEMMIQSGILSNPYSGKSFNFIGQIDKLLKRGDNALVLNILANMSSKDPGHIKMIAANKDQIMKAILGLIKRGGDTHMIKSTMRNIEHMGLEWPEFAVIRKSLEAEMRESMLPGDVLMIESDREAVVGTVLSIDEGMIILEGGVYPLGDSDIDDIDTNTIDEMLDEHLREALAEYPELYENDEKYKEMTGFLSSYDTINAVPDTNYIYVVVQTVPVAGIVSIGYFPESKRLIRVVDNRYLFDIGGEVKAFPAGDHSGTDLFRKSFLFSSIEEFIEFKTMLTLKFGDWRIRTNPIFKPIDISEAKYQGREVQLGKPMRGDVKKYRVYIKDPKTGNVKKVNFGDKNMEIKRDDPARRKSFRARHGCGTPRASDRTKAAYWSCRLWSTKSVGDILKGK
jgi:hypothetical protein